jgi:hypothetical protein
MTIALDTNAIQPARLINRIRAVCKPIDRRANRESAVVSCDSLLSICLGTASESARDGGKLLVDTEFILFKSIHRRDGHCCKIVPHLQFEKQLYPLIAASAFLAVATH